MSIVFISFVHYNIDFNCRLWYCILKQYMKEGDVPLEDTKQVSDFRKVVARNIKAARKAKKLTQPQLAELIGRHESSIRKYEKGLTDVPNEVIQKIAEVLDTKPGDLLAVEEWDAAFNEDEKLAKEVRILEQIKAFYGEEAVKVLEIFTKLNEKGQTRALFDLQDLVEIPRYQRKSED